MSLQYPEYVIVAMDVSPGVNWVAGFCADREDAERIAATTRAAFVNEVRVARITSIELDYRIEEQC